MGICPTFEIITLKQNDSPFNIEASLVLQGVTPFERCLSSGGVYLVKLQIWVAEVVMQDRIWCNLRQMVVM